MAGEGKVRQIGSAVLGLVNSFLAEVLALFLFLATPTTTIKTTTITTAATASSNCCSFSYTVNKEE